MRPLMIAVWRFLRAPRAILYLAIALLSAGLDMREDLSFKLGRGECERIDVLITLLYKRFTTLEFGFRKPRSHYVRLVVLSRNTLLPNDVDVLANVCKKRQLLAKLIRGINRLNASLISIDLYPQSIACSGNEDQELADAIKSVSTGTSIIFAKHTETLEDLIANSDPDVESLKTSGFSDRDLLMAPHLPLEGQMLGYGISRLSCDTRAVPISWIAYPDPKSFLKHLPPQSEVSFAYKTAITYDSELDRFVEEFRSRHKHMVISFIPEEDFLSVAPRDILPCLDNLDNNNPDCLRDLQAKFRGKIALIGEVSSSDMHRSVIRSDKVPGYLLQANYVEGLLDDRYSSPLTVWTELPLSVLGILVVVMLFELSDQAEGLRQVFRPLLGVLLSYVFIILLFVLCGVWRVYFGIEADFWAPLLPLPLMEVVYSWRVQARPDAQNGDAP